MGGKASAEIANLYCYTIESQYIDKLIAADKIKEARDWLNTWRYIDDMEASAAGHGTKSITGCLIWTQLMSHTIRLPKPLRLCS